MQSMSAQHQNHIHVHQPVLNHLFHAHKQRATTVNSLLKKAMKIVLRFCVGTVELCDEAHAPDKIILL